VASLFGPKICGDSIDFKDDGVTMVTGSYRDENCIELWDLRTYEKTQDVNWDGPTGKIVYNEFHQDAESSEIEEKLRPPKIEDEDGDEEEQKDQKEIEEKKNEPEMPKKKSTPFVYTCLFNNEHNLIIAGGAGDNEIRVFDSENLEVLTAYKYLPKAVTCATKASNTADFTFGSVDSKVRVMVSRNNFL